MMSLAKPRLIALAVLAGFALTSCGGGGASPISPSGRLESSPGKPRGQIVLSAVGAQRIGLQTQTVRAAGPKRSAGVRVPYSAVVYDPSGQTYAFTRVAPLTFIEVPITVAHISGSTAYLVRGPKPGTPVVSVGGEELFGVQTGVLAQT